MPNPKIKVDDMLDDSDVYFQEVSLGYTRGARNWVKSITRYIRQLENKNIELSEQNNLLQFMVEHGLGEEDLFDDRLHGRDIL